MKKILAFSSIRSDYDLMLPLYRLLHEDENIDFRIVVSGAHLSHSFGYSAGQIRKDQFDIFLEIETLLNSDTDAARVKSASILLQGSVDPIAKFNPDLMIYAGDREDVLIYSMIGAYLNIPTVHVFSGDHVEDGYVDNPTRHAASKLSTAHFVTLEEHRKRLVRLGEESKRIFVVGSIALDRFVNFQPLSKIKIKNFFGKENSFDNFALVIFHPITEEIENAGKYFRNILESLLERGINSFVSYPNVDPGNQQILDVIEQYKDNGNFIFYKNLERDMFMSVYKHSNFIIGNSSSGICEAASLKIPAINVGLRQTGRYADQNVIFCGTSRKEIGQSIDKATEEDFVNGLKTLQNSYGNGNSAKKAYDLIKSINFRSMVAKIKDPLKMN